jgi:UDP-N-acetylglucosamine/UDP-N-acetyl-alpha-D-glucosaminouronate 4-epimerase
MPTLERVLVTGGAGFIGSHLTRRLVELGHTVRVLDDFSTGKRSNLDGLGDRVEMLEGSVTDMGACSRSVEAVDTVFHLAAKLLPGPDGGDSEEFSRVNATGTAKLLTACVKSKRIKKFIFASSASVYGDAPSPQAEVLTPRPKSPYASSKVAAENAVRSTRDALDWTILRYFNVYGPGQNRGLYGVIPVFVTEVMGGRRPTVFGDGGQTRDFVFVDDVVEATLLAAQGASTAGETINIGTGRPTEINALLSIITEVAKRGKVEVRYVDARPQDIRHSCADTKKMTEELHFRPRTKLSDGVTAVVESLSPRTASGAR